MRIGSLCTGYSGLDMGVQAVLGGELAWVSDIDKGSCKLLAHRHPAVPNLGDFTRTDWSTVEPIDVLTAGFPCQPVSHAGKQLGDNDERWLWDDVARAIGDLRPGLVVLENVRGLLTAGSGRLFGRVLGALAGLGYDAQWVGLRAADVGSPHGRWRVFIAAYPARHPWRVIDGDGGSAADAGRLRGDEGWVATPGQTEGGGAQSVSRVGRGVGAGGALNLLPTPAVNDMGEGKTVEAWDAWTDAMKAKHGNGNGHGASLAIEAQRLLPTPRVMAEVKTSERAKRLYSSKDSMGDVVEKGAWGQYAAAIARWETVTRPAPPPTETGPKGNPRLSARFSEWLMGLPDGWITDVPGLTRNEALKLAGNGVVPQQAAEALRFLLGAREAVA